MALGADPEFELHNRHGFVSAAQAFIYAPANSAVGLDGCNNTGEIRPTPGTPASITAAVSNHIAYLNQAVGNDLQAYAGSGIYVPLGGHIHFSGVPCSPILRDLLDITVAKPLNSLSNPTSLYNRRERSSYGRYGSFRPQAWGWEYRAPLSWISHPIVCRGALELAYQTAKLYVDATMTQGTEVDYLYGVILKPEDILEFIDEKGPALVIEKFFDFASELRRNGLYLEDIEMFQAWRKRTTRFQEALSDIPEEQDEDYDDDHTRYIFSFPSVSFEGFLPENYTDDDHRYINCYMSQLCGALDGTLVEDNPSLHDYRESHHIGQLTFLRVSNDDYLQQQLCDVPFAVPDIVEENVVIIQDSEVSQSERFDFRFASDGGTHPALPFSGGHLLDFISSSRTDFGRIVLDESDTTRLQHLFPITVIRVPYPSNFRTSVYPRQIRVLVNRHSMRVFPDVRFPVMVFLRMYHPGSAYTLGSYCNFPFDVRMLDIYSEPPEREPGIPPIDTSDYLQKVEAVLKYKPKRSKNLCAV